MLKLNQEYTYKKICEELGWKESSGGQKQKQIKEIESSFEFYHPENKKTHKPKKSYIFTKQLKEPELEDKRKTNSGVKRVPDGVFEYLFKCVLSSGVQRNEYHQGEIIRCFQLLQGTCQRGYRTTGVTGNPLRHIFLIRRLKFCSC